jgi:hypothetical protein
VGGSATPSRSGTASGVTSPISTNRFGATAQIEEEPAGFGVDEGRMLTSKAARTRSALHENPAFGVSGGGSSTTTNYLTSATSPMEQQPLLPPPRDPSASEAALSEAAQAAAARLNSQPYPAFFNRPDVLAKIPLHAQFHFVVPASRNPIALLRLELAPKGCSPVSILQPLLFQVDKHAEFFRGPAQLSVEQMEEKFVENKTLATVAKMFRNILGKRQVRKRDKTNKCGNLQIPCVCVCMCVYM